MEEFDLRNFEIFYSTKLEPELIKFEKERKKMIIGVIIPIICSIFSLLCFFIVPMVCFFIFIENGDIQSAPNISTGIAACFAITTLVCAMWGYFKVKKIKTNIKTKLYNTIFNTIGCQYTNDDIIINQFCYLIENIFSSKDVVAQQLGVNVNVDDIIKGQYKSLPFSAIDTFINYGISSKNKAFRGIVLATKINKPLKCDIIIKSKTFVQTPTLSGNQKIKLESIEFEKMFEVYSNDQIEARYILTPSFMERLLRYRKQKGEVVEIYMSDNIKQNANVFFFIPTWKDNFELPLFESINNKSAVFNIIRELTDALDVISELKLDQNIGL